MSSKARPAFRILRYSAFFLMALMLLVRLGPLCETMAMAATPAASAMIDCASESKQNPAKKIPPSACAMPCAAVAGESVEPIKSILFGRLAPYSGEQATLFGQTSAPATPPPQIV